MNEATLLLYLINFAVIGMLPFIFFKQGRFNLMWCLTAAPYVLSAVFLIASYTGVLPPVTRYHTYWSNVAGVIAVPLSVSSIALIFVTMGTHRVPLALWHQQQDGPHHIVTYGPYRRIRHPFYAAFLLALFGAFLFAPQPGTLATLLYAFIVLNFTAGKEEKRLKNSPFGSEYEQYMQQAGRFWPKLRLRAVDQV
jgi:protein-S-isoprenylcysteine O-methyltransferase Ste14